MVSHLREGVKAAITLCVLVHLATVAAKAQSYRNTLTFINQSGESALVKVVGPVRAQVFVNNNRQGSLHVPGGEYYIWSAIVMPLVAVITPEEIVCRLMKAARSIPK